MKISLDLDKSNLIIPDGKSDKELIKEIFFAAFKLNEELLKRRQFQFVIFSILTKLNKAINEIELNDLELFICKLAFEEARFPIDNNNIIIQIYKKLGI